MAAKKKSGKSRAGSATATKIQNSAARKEAVQGRRQLLSVIWFAVAVFLLCVVFIPGQNVWLAIHNFIFGVFGVTAYFYPFLLGFVAVLFAMDKIGGSMNAKNAEELLSKTNVDGGLIGGASLKAADFTTIIKAAVNG